MIRSEIESKLLDELHLLSPAQLADILRYVRFLRNGIQPVKPFSEFSPLNLKRLARFRIKQPLSLTDSLQHLEALRQKARY